MITIYKHIDSNKFAVLDADENEHNIYEGKWLVTKKHYYDTFLAYKVSAVATSDMFSNSSVWEEVDKIHFISYDGYPVRVGDMLHTVGKMNLAQDHLMCTEAITDKTETTLYFVKEENAIEYVNLHELQYSKQDLIFAMMWAIESDVDCDIAAVYDLYQQNRLQYKNSVLEQNAGDKDFLLSF